VFTKCAVMAFKVMRCLIVFAEPGEGEWVGTSADLDAIGGGPLLIQFAAPRP